MEIQTETLPIIHSRHLRPLDNGRMPEHFYVMREARLAGETTRENAALIIERNKSWSCGLELLFDWRDERHTHPTLKTSSHRTFGSALKKALHFVPDRSSPASGHELLNEIEFVRRISGDCAGARRPENIFPDIHAVAESLLSSLGAKSPLR